MSATTSEQEIIGQQRLLLAAADCYTRELLALMELQLQ